jgi:hypothetical protein
MIVPGGGLSLDGARWVVLVMGVILWLLEVASSSESVSPVVPVFSPYSHDQRLRDSGATRPALQGKMIVEEPKCANSAPWATQAFRSRG